MPELTLTTAIILAGLSSGYALGMHSAGTGALMASANPSVPPSLTPDARLTGSAPLPPHHQPTRAALVRSRSHSLPIRKTAGRSNDRRHLPRLLIILDRNRAALGRPLRI
jgi:hypothetical protein